MARTGLSPADLRDKALDVALQQIRAVGVEKVRLAAVAKEMGVSHAALYAYFRDKEALLDEATGLWLDHLDRVVTEGLAQLTDAKTRLRQWFVLRYQEKRERALTDPEPYRAYSLAGTSGRPFLEVHHATMMRQVTALVTEAGLGGAAEARLLIEGTQLYSHPVLIIALVGQDRTVQLQALLDVLIAGLKCARK